MSETYLSRKEASTFLSALGLFIAPSTLAKLASVGGGPVFRRFGRQVKYLPRDLISWAESRLSGPVHSTSQFLLDDQKESSSERDEKNSPLATSPSDPNGCGNSPPPGCC